MNDFFNNILGMQFEIQLLFIVCFSFIIINCILLLLNIKKTNKIKTKYSRFMNGLSDRNIEELLDTCLNNVNSVSMKNRDIELKINNIERNLMQCVQKVGIIRFNAFDNVGSDLSFAIALLDTNDTGVVISGIYARDSSSTYAKPIMSGKSKYSLSAEEIQAIDIAKKTSIERNYTNN
ncbi:uncharacterized protein DUF4446 [Ruminiclostridium sufflavum DSM 19573]|uniref:Uncharacterized protein DUF4446 n=1 Tax=Ruminiclostridium sufflavum DSM 19573 TaxID=1121337 RepID=A0A318XMB9_9FIRM|nr:DUF4446 family protein [Ruminiclostridium sufflavum]PYG89002.1 uncharacterized protein DUF4446 [Ruminiclostridium sufflavum DSM 19573]